MQELLPSRIPLPPHYYFLGLPGMSYLQRLLLSSCGFLLLIVSFCAQQVLSKDLLNGIEYNYASNVSS